MFSFFWVPIFFFFVKLVSIWRRIYKFVHIFFPLILQAIIILGVDCSPKIQVHTTTYNDTFKIIGNETFPYDTIDVHPILGHVVFLIVGADDFSEITKSKYIIFQSAMKSHSISSIFNYDNDITGETLQREYHSLENKIKYNHGAHLALIGCFDIG